MMPAPRKYPDELRDRAVRLVREDGQRGASRGLPIGSTSTVRRCETGSRFCDVLGWNVSTYYAFKRRPSSDRALRDEHLADEARRVREADSRVYGYRQIYAQPKREGFTVAQCTVRRLMRQEGISGVVRGHRKPKTTIRDEHAGASPGPARSR
jgi:hypothetical protein